MAKRTCSVHGCERAYKARGWCTTHYKRWVQYGTPDLPPRKTMEERFWEKVEVGDHLDCWLWTGAHHPLGYGNFRTADGYEGAHRVAYRLTQGGIPEGTVLDHLCRTPACVNPAHLEPVTQRINVLRGEGLSAKRAKQTHCKRGHPLSGANLYTGPRGDRRCRTCTGRVAP